MLTSFGTKGTPGYSIPGLLAVPVTYLPFESEEGGGGAPEGSGDVSEADIADSEGIFEEWDLPGGTR